MLKLKINDEHPNTFFFVKVTTEGEAQSLGPYYSIESATTILVDFVPSFVRALFPTQLETEYVAEIHECAFGESDWQTVSVLVKEIHE
tara:strand:+ start:1100 stop:1363 length:264 start_codon:yes stop_codon:yes gene_type:complete